MIQRITLFILFAISTYLQAQQDKDVLKALVLNLAQENYLESLRVWAISQKLSIAVPNNELWSSIIHERQGMCANNSKNQSPLQQLNYLLWKLQPVSPLNQDVQTPSTSNLPHNGYFLDVTKIPLNEIPTLKLHTKACTRLPLSSDEIYESLSQLLALRDLLAASLSTVVHMENLFFLEAWLMLKIQETQDTSERAIALRRKIISILGNSLSTLTEDQLRQIPSELLFSVISILHNEANYEEKCSQIALNRVTEDLKWLTLVNLHHDNSQRQLPQLLQTVQRKQDSNAVKNSANIWLQLAYYHRIDNPALAIQELQQIKSAPSDIIKLKKKLTISILQTNIHLLSQAETKRRLISPMDKHSLLSLVAVHSVIDPSYVISNDIKKALTDSDFPLHWLDRLKTSSVSSWNEFVTKQLEADASIISGLKHFIIHFTNNITQEQPSQFSKWQEKLSILIRRLPKSQQTILLKQIETAQQPKSEPETPNSTHELNAQRLLEWPTYLPLTLPTLEKPQVTIGLLPYKSQLNLLQLAWLNPSSKSVTEKNPTSPSKTEFTSPETRPLPQQQLNVYVNNHQQELTLCLKKSYPELSSVKLTGTILPQGQLVNLETQSVTAPIKTLIVPECLTTLFFQLKFIEKPTLETIETLLKWN